MFARPEGFGGRERSVPHPILPAGGLPAVGPDTPAQIKRTIRLRALSIRLRTSCTASEHHHQGEGLKTRRCRRVTYPESYITTKTTCTKIMSTTTTVLRFAHPHRSRYSCAGYEHEVSGCQLEKITLFSGEPGPDSGPGCLISVLYILYLCET